MNDSLISSSISRGRMRSRLFGAVIANGVREGGIDCRMERPARRSDGFWGDVESYPNTQRKSTHVPSHNPFTDNELPNVVTCPVPVAIEAAQTPRRALNFSIRRAAPMA